jgi:hypothetical protein
VVQQRLRAFARPSARRYRPPVPTTIRPIKDDELAAWFAASGTAFYIWANDPHAMAEFRRPTLEIDRAIGAFEDGTIVGTFRSFATRLTVPGGARIPVNAVSAVTVRPTHRRQGILTRMIGDDTRLAVCLRPSPPDCENAANLAQKVLLLRSLGVTQTDFYHYGFLRLGALDWIRTALDADQAPVGGAM